MHDVAMHYCESGVGKLRSLSLSVVMLLSPIPISFLLSSLVSSSPSQERFCGQVLLHGEGKLVSQVCQYCCRLAAKKKSWQVASYIQVAGDCHESNVHQSTRVHAMFGCSCIQLEPRGSVNLKIFKQAESDIRIWRDMNMYLCVAFLGDDNNLLQ